MLGYVGMVRGIEDRIFVHTLDVRSAILPPELPHIEDERNQQANRRRSSF